jgi:hypothetical protein
MRLISRATDCPWLLSRQNAGHGIVSRIIIRPNFRPATALPDCKKEALRWPGPFGSGFLSPQPPGAVGIGPVRRKYPTLGQRKLVLFLGGRVELSPQDGGDLLVQNKRRHSGMVPTGRRSRPPDDKLRTRPGMTVFEVSAATYTPPLTSGRACRDCHPGHRPPRHRRPRGKCFPRARSSCRHYHSSRRLSASCAPHCGR